MKLLKFEQVSPDTATAVFCSDVGWSLKPSADQNKTARYRAALDLYVMKYAIGVDGKRHWLSDSHIQPTVPSSDPVFPGSVGYQKQCDKWAQHEKP